MKTHSSPALLLAMGVLGATAALLPLRSGYAASVDTSQWTCEKCPYPKDARSALVQGSVEGGLALVKGRTPTFGDYNGLDRDKAHLILGGDISYRGGNGYYADAQAAELGTDTRSLSASSGREGIYGLQLRYGEIPRRFAEGARTPFGGIGGNRLSLPAGFAAATPAAMPLAATLQLADLGLKATQLDLGAKFVGHGPWTFRADVSRFTREGTRPGYGSFFSTAAQLPLGVDEATDQLQLSASYRAAQWQLSLSYLLSRYGNTFDGLSWDNPFTPVVAGATRGQTALAPDNQFQQVMASGGYQLTPMIRVSADIGFGVGTQNAAFLPATLTPGLVVPALPAAGLDGEVQTFDASVRVSATPMPGLRLTGSYARNVRDNRTDVLSITQVATDMFVGGARSTTPFDLTQDRVKVAADYRGPGSLRLAAGVDWDQRERNYHEVVRTQETTAWARAGLRPLAPLGLSVKAAYAQREASTQGVAYWFPANNPLARQLHLAERRRSSAGIGVEWAVSDAVNLSFGADIADDDYPETTIGLNESRTEGLHLAISAAPTDTLQLTAFAQSEKTRARQTGSQLFAAPDWTGRTEDRFDLLGLSGTYAAIPDKLDLGAEVSASRGWRDTWVQTGVLEPAFPSATVRLDRARLFGSYKFSDKVTLHGSWTYESYRAADWALDSVSSANVFNLLAFGNAAPKYHANVVRVSARYRF
jgi:MtrB/PioB family decaheme-associated outer membrane protein